MWTDTGKDPAGSEVRLAMRIQPPVRVPNYFEDGVELGLWRVFQQLFVQGTFRVIDKLRQEIVEHESIEVMAE